MKSQKIALIDIATIIETNTVSFLELMKSESIGYNIHVHMCVQGVSSHLHHSWNLHETHPMLFDWNTKFVFLEGFCGSNLNICPFLHLSSPPPTPLQEISGNVLGVVLVFSFSQLLSSSVFPHPWFRFALVILCCILVKVTSLMPKTLNQWRWGSMTVFTLK